MIAIDNTGVGNSGRATPDNVAAMARDAIDVITAIGIRKCDILGFSLGGFIAQAMAVIKSDLLRKIILVGTAPQGTRVWYSFPQLAEKAFEKSPVESFLFLFANGSESSKSKITAALPRLRERTKDKDKPSARPVIQAQINAITRWGTDLITINLHTIQQPVMIIQGSHDEMMDSNSSMELFRQIPISVLTYYPDSAHGSYFQYPDMFVEQANFFQNNY